MSDVTRENGGGEAESAVALVEEPRGPVELNRAGVGPSGSLLLPSPEQLQTLQQFGEMYVQSGLLPDGIKTWQAVAVIIQHGMDLGIPISTALQKISIIKGKPVCDAALMASLIYRDHGDDALRVVESTDKLATYAYKRRSWSEYATYTYTIEDAARAKLLDKPGAGGGPGMWKTYPKSMLRARCLADIAHAQFQDTIGGLYLQDELDHLRADRPAPPERIAASPDHPNGVAAEVIEATPAMTDQEFADELRRALDGRDGLAYRRVVDAAGDNIGRWVALVQACDTTGALDWIEARIGQEGIREETLEREVIRRAEMLTGVAGGK